MARRRLLFLGVVLCMIGLEVSVSPAFAADEVESWFTDPRLSASNEAGESVIRASLDTGAVPQQPSQVEEQSGSSDAVDESAERRSAPPPPENCSPVETTACAGTPAAPAAPEAPVDPGEPALTLSDVASFRPASAAFAMQPDGWAVVGLAANFIADAAVHTTSGALLGRQVEVRFTPVAYEWRFSDGVVVASSTRGGSWADLGAREFTDTATSRRFDESGRVTAQLVVRYAAEYRFAGSVWRGIAGTLEVPGASREIVVGELDTVLTDGDCLTRPSGPGC
ncbi:hypothetical protein ACWKWP_01805 [Agromyces soli]